VTSVAHEDGKLLGFDLFELMPDAILAVDRRGVILYANGQAGRLFGREPANLVSMPVEALLPEHLRERHVAHRTRYMAEPRMRPMGTGLDLVARRADGVMVPVDIMLNPLKHLAEPIVLAVVRDMTDRRAAEHLLMREVNHRAKNILSVVQAMAQQTKASSCEEHVARLNDRIRSLSASYDLLIRNEWQSASLVELVRGQLAHFGDLLDSRIAVRGRELTIRSKAAQIVGMALHELATNAAKYGALSTGAGRVDIVWDMKPVGTGQQRFSMEWRESGGPAVLSPTQHGFGWSVLCQLTKMSLDADVTFECAPTGVVWRLECPADRVREDETPRQGNNERLSHSS
jgi:PAS domain S-box-containing protein